MATTTALASSVEALVRAATSEADPRVLRPTVEKVLDAFDDASVDARNAALRAIGKALGKVEGRGTQILCLALGALVEAGASPEIAWPIIARDLKPKLDQAAAFANAVVRKAKDEHVEVALEVAGADVAKKKPAEANAWRTLPARCIAAVACLIRSKKVRALTRKEDVLINAAWPLSDVVSEVGDLLQALRIADEETLLVLVPAEGRGWRIAIDCMPSNGDLYILLADELIGDPKKKGRLPGKRLDAKAVAAVRQGRHPKKAASTIVAYQLVGWPAVDADGSLATAASTDSEHWIWVEGVPGDIPMLGDERIILLQEPSVARPIAIEPSFEGLAPKLEVIAQLTPQEVTRAMVKIATAVARSKEKTTKGKPKAKAKKKKPPTKL